MSEDDFTGGDAVVAVYHQKYLGLFWTRLHPSERWQVGKDRFGMLEAFLQSDGHVCQQD